MKSAISRESDERSLREAGESLHKNLPNGPRLVGE